MYTLYFSKIPAQHTENQNSENTENSHRSTQLLHPLDWVSKPQPNVAQKMFETPKVRIHQARTQMCTHFHDMTFGRTDRVLAQNSLNINIWTSMAASKGKGISHVVVLFSAFLIFPSFFRPPLRPSTNLR